MVTMVEWTGDGVRNQKCGYEDIDYQTGWCGCAQLRFWPVK